MRRLGALVAGSLLVVLLAPAAKAVPTVERLAGPTRYDTAAAVAQYLHPDGATTAVVAAGTNYPDALSAGVAAAALDAPLLLASSTYAPVDALKAMGVQDVVLIGGTAALPGSIADRIAAATGATVRRIAGANRYETAAAVADATAPDATLVFQASGDSFQSALVAAVHAARTGARLLLSPDMAADEVIVDGVTLEGDVGTLNNALIARYPTASSEAIVATIDSFPDALAATAIAGALDAPVLFTGSLSAGSKSLALMHLLDPVSLIVVGGSAAVPDLVLQQLFGWAPLPPVVAAGAESSIARDVFTRINAERAARHVAPLVWDPTLAADAAAWAREMSRTGYRHAAVKPGIGENIHSPGGWCDDGACHLPTSGLLHRDWMQSSGNRDNVVEPGYVIVGVGVYCGPDGTLWAVERFGIGFSGLSAGGTPATPVVRDDTGGVDCTGS